MGIFDVLGGGNQSRRGMSPIALAVLGVLAYRTMKGKGRLADMLGTSEAAKASGGGLAGGGLGAGLKDVLDRFRQTGHQEQAQSWVSKGANREIAPGELEEVLGAERIQWLMEQTGLPKDQLLSGLSNELPGAIDELTPEGQVPTDEELSRRFRQ